MAVWIKDAEVVVAWDEGADRHVYLECDDVVFEGNAITFVGRSYAGAADEIVDGAGLAMLPGFVNLHAHPTFEPAYGDIREEHGVPTMFMTGLYERGQAFTPDAEGRLAAAEIAYCELLLNGSPRRRRACCGTPRTATISGARRTKLRPSAWTDASPRKPPSAPS